MVIKKFRLLGLIFFSFVLLICGACVAAFSSVQTAEAATPPRYTMTMNGTQSSSTWGGSHTVDVIDQTKISIRTGLTGTTADVSLYLNGGTYSGSAILPNNGYITDFDYVHITSSYSNATLTLYNSSGKELVSGKGTIACACGQGSYKVNLKISLSGGAGYTQWGSGVDVDSYFFVDTFIPTITGASTSATGKYTNSSFTVTASDSGSGIASLYMKKPGSSTFTSSSSSSKTVSSGSANGLYTFYAKDKAGNESGYYYVYYDDTLPTGILKTADGVSLATGTPVNESFQYTATDSGSGIASLQYKKPGSSAWTNYTSGTLISADTSPNGWYYFRAMDKAGNYSAEKSVCLDTGKPSGIVYKENSSVSDGSIVKGSFIKFTASDTLSGVAACFVKKPGASLFVLYTSGTPMMEEGRYEFYAVDNAGNKSATYTIGLDNTKPIGTLTGGGINKSDGNIVNSNYISFSATDDYSGISALYVKKPGSDSFVSYTAAAQLTADGKYEFYCIDRAGNISVTYNITLDRTSPTGNVYGGTSVLPGGSMTNADYVKYTAADALSGVAKCYVKEPGADTFSEYVQGTRLTEDGLYTFYCTDVAGNTSERLTITLDRTKPIGHLFGGSSEIVNGSYVNAAYIRFEPTDETSGIGKIYVKMPGDETFSEYLSSTQLTTEGKYEFYATDVIGNRSETYIVTLDRTAPIGVMYAAGNPLSDGAITNAANVSFNATDNLGIVTAYVKKPGQNSFEPFDMGTVFTAEGKYEFYCLDAANNKSAVLSILLDKTKPETVLYAGSDKVGSGTKSNAAYVKLSASDGLSGIERIFVKLPGASGFVEYTSGSQLTAEGEYSFYAVDKANNVSETVHILIDRVKPVGQLYAGNAELENGSHTNAAYIKFDATDDSSGVAEMFAKTPGDDGFIKYDPKTVFSLEGTYEFFVKDMAGNVSVTYTVTVDRVAPTGSIYIGLNAVESGLITNGEYITYKATDDALAGLFVKKPDSDKAELFSAGTKFTVEGKYEFYSLDLAGNRSIIVTVTLDNTSPEGKLYADGVELESGLFKSAESISFTANDAISGVKTLLVKLPGKSEFTSYNSGDKLTENGRYEFKAVDRAGNESGIYSIVLDNIVPVGKLTADGIEFESGAVTNRGSVIFIATDEISGIAVLYVKIGEEPWQVYAAGEEITKEGVIRFYCEDVAGNRSAEYFITVDRTKPVGTLSSPDGGYTNESFSYTATDSCTGIARSEMKTPEGEWTEYILGTVIPENSDNGWYRFRCVDFAGNFSEEMSVYLDTVRPTGQLYVNGAPAESGSYTNLERVHFIAYDENVSECYVLEPGSEEWTKYSSGALYSDVGKYEFYVVDKAGNRSETYRVVIDRTQKPLILNNVKNGLTDENVTITWKNGDVDTCAPVVSVTVNGKTYINGEALNTIAEGLYIVESIDAAGNIWTTEFESERRNILTDTVNREWWEAADSDGQYFAFATQENALAYAAARERAMVRMGQWTNPDEWDTGIIMDSKDSINAAIGRFFIYKKSGDPATEVAYFTEERLNEVILEYAEIGIRHFYYWNGEPSSAAEGEEIYVLNAQGVYLASEIILSDNAQFYIDGELFVGSLYDIAGKHEVVVKDDWGNETCYTIIVVRELPEIQFAVGSNDYTQTDATHIYYLKNKTKLKIIDPNDEFAMFTVRDTAGKTLAVLSLGEEYEITHSGMYVIQAVNHFGLTQEITFYLSLDVPKITFEEDTENKNLILKLIPSMDEYAELTSITIYKSFDGGSSWVVLTVDDYGQQIAADVLEYRFRTSGIYRVVAENAFYTGFEAITDSLDYVQPEPIGELQGVENHGHTNGAVRFVWADEAIVSVEKDGESIEYVSGQELTADGAYTVMLENYDGFRVVYEFVIDKTAPEIKLDGVEDGGVTNRSVSITVTETDLDIEVYWNGKVMENYVTGQTLKAEGDYKILVRDLAGNVAEVSFTIDKSVSFIADFYENAVVNSAVIVADETLFVSVEKDGESVEYTFGETLFEPGLYTVTLADILGNSQELHFTIVEPKMQTFIHDFGDVTGLNALTVNGETADLAENILALSESGVYEIGVTVNGVFYTFTVTVDATAPVLTIEGVENGGTTKGKVILGDVSETAEVQVYRNNETIEYVSGMELSEVGIYHIVVTDEVGNVTEYSFEIEKSLNGGIIALIVIAVLAVVGVGVFLLLKKRKKI